MGLLGGVATGAAAHLVAADVASLAWWGVVGHGGRGRDVGGRWEEEGRWGGGGEWVEGYTEENHGGFPWREFHFVTAQYLPV